MSDEPRFTREVVPDPEPLDAVWEHNAAEWIAWARASGHDSYWRFHREAFLDLLPPPGRLTLDIGCGEGRLARDLKERGHVLACVDLSPTALAAARTADPTIELHLADAARLPFPDAAADLALAFMSLQDVADAREAIREAARVLEPGGRYCLAIVHPFTSAGEFESFEDDSPFVVTGSYLHTFRYRDVLERAGMRVTLESEHRPIGWYAEALEQAGFLIERLREVSYDEVPRRRRIPLFLHIRALRP
jgi:ubiquinone/menaquinone biosynthesis C-methylase UbiE